MAFARDGRSMGGARPGGGGGRRLEALGRVSAEVLHDLGAALAALELRARVAAGEARAGRIPMTELERVVELSADLGALLRDAVDALGGASVSPEATADARQVVDTAVRRLLPTLTSVQLRVTLDVEGPAPVRGPASFLSRAVANLVANAARHARSEVRVTLAPAPGGDALLLEVEDDGDGLDPFREAALEDLLAGRGDAVPEAGLGVGSAVWSVERLGGTLRYRRGEALGGAWFQVRLPAAATAILPPGGP